MLRDFAAIRRDPVAYLAKVWANYGDVVQFPVPSPPSYLVNDPSAVRRVLVGNARNYGKATIQYRSLSLVTGTGLLTADTPQWRRQRPLVQPAFHRDTLERVAADTAAAAQSLGERWERVPAGELVDIDSAMMTTALAVVGRSLFGTDLSADAAALTTATLSALDVVVARARPSIPLPAWLPTPENRKLRNALVRLDAAVAGILAGRDPDDPGRDMVGMLLSARDDRGEGLTSTEVRDQLVTFIVAGHETVAAAMTWALALLAAHPEHLQALQEESDRVLAGRAVTFHDVANLPFARAVLDEAMRLYPPAWLITRNALDADELGGFAVPAGALVILSPWLAHRHPDRWERPEKFDPARFLGAGVDRTAFIPFGAGPRQCIGRDFAYTESVMLLSSLAAQFDLSYPPGAGIPDYDPLVTVRPRNGLQLLVRPRRQR